MAKIDYKAASKISWQGAGNAQSENFPGIDYVNMASLQRIADATEKMAVNHIALQREYELMKGDRDRYKEMYLRRDKIISNLRGQITKLKNKLNSLSGNK